MAVPKSKQELLEAIESSFNKLYTDLQSIPVQNVNLQEIEGHKSNTMMSVHNLVSYLVGWNELVLKWVKKSEAQEPISFPEEGYKWNQLGDLAQKFYRDYKLIDYPVLLEKLVIAKESIIQIIENKSDEELYGKDWYRNYTLGRMIQFNTFSPYKNARTRIRKWKKNKIEK